MKTRLLLALMSVLVVAAFLLGRSLVADAQTARPQKVVWEYRDAANLSLAAMNALGAEGWELTGMTTYEKEIYYIFKRVK